MENEKNIENGKDTEKENNIQDGKDIKNEKIIEKGNDVSSTWDDLNDECCEKIFSYLEIQDRLTVEKVCQRWKGMLLTGSSWQDLQMLQFTAQNHKVFKHLVLPRCGRYLTEITFSIQIPPDYLQTVANYCTKLRKLSLGATLDICDAVLSQVFEANPGIAQFTVSNNSEFIGRCLTHLNVNHLETLEITKCSALAISYVKQLDRFVNLKQLILDYHDDDNLLVRGSHYLFPAGLHTLSLTSISTHHSDVLMMIVLLRHLRCLYLTYLPQLSDQLLGSIARNCPDLADVGIACCDCVTDAGIMDILRLRKLQSLQLYGLGQVTDAVLYSPMPPRLAYINISLCLTTTCEAVEYLIENTDSLKRVRIQSWVDMVRGADGAWEYDDAAVGCVRTAATENAVC